MIYPVDVTVIWYYILYFIPLSGGKNRILNYWSESWDATRHPLRVSVLKGELMAILWAMWWIEETKQKILSSAQIQLPPPCLLLKMGHRALALFVQDRGYGTGLDFLCVPGHLLRVMKLKIK